MPEWYVDNDESSFHRFHYRRRVIDHLVECDGQCGFVTSHYIRSRVANENNVDTSAIDDLRHAEIICSEHSDLLTAVLHFLKLVRGDLLDVLFLCGRQGG